MLNQFLALILNELPNRHPLQNKNPQDVDLMGFAIYRCGATSTKKVFLKTGNSVVKLHTTWLN
jgi:hypothetical protein